MTNTGTSSINQGIVVTASGGTVNNAITATGNVVVAGSLGVTSTGTFYTATNSSQSASNLAVFGGTIGTSSDARLTFAGASSVQGRMWSSGAASSLTANNSYATYILGNPGITEASSGTHALIANQVIKSFTVTNAGGATTVLTGLYIEGPPTGITPTNPITSMWVDAGVSRFDGAVLNAQGADVASVSGAIALGNDGNSFEITGTNAITLISNVGWQNGSKVTLLFTSTASLTDGTANSGTDIGMELNGNANFTGSAGATLTLVLSEIGGTQRWRETARSVN